MRPTGSPELVFQRRLRVVRRVIDDGVSQAQAAREGRVSTVSVCTWVALYRQGGQDALRVKSPPGRPRGLTDKQARDVVRCILRGAKAHGWETDLWTLPRIAQLIKQRHRVDYHPDHLSRLMRQWKLSWQKPATCPIERDQTAIDHWIAHDWKRIKKKSRG